MSKKTEENFCEGVGVLSAIGMREEKHRFFAMNVEDKGVGLILGEYLIFADNWLKYEEFFDDDDMTLSFYKNNLETAKKKILGIYAIESDETNIFMKTPEDFAERYHDNAVWLRDDEDDELHKAIESFCDKYGLEADDLEEFFGRLARIQRLMNNCPLKEEEE